MGQAMKVMRSHVRLLDGGQKCRITMLKRQDTLNIVFQDSYHKIFFNEAKDNRFATAPFNSQFMKISGLKRLFNPKVRLYLLACLVMAGQRGGWMATPTTAKKSHETGERRWNSKEARQKRI